MLPKSKPSLPHNSVEGFRWSRQWYVCYVRRLLRQAGTVLCNWVRRVKVVSARDTGSAAYVSIVLELASGDLLGALEDL